MVDDCSGDGDQCPSSWIGDGFADCEDQQYGCDLSCYDNDGGDCSPLQKMELFLEKDDLAKERCRDEQCEEMNSDWRDIKTCGDIAYIGSEESEHNGQAVNLSQVVNLFSEAGATGPLAFSVVDPGVLHEFGNFGNSHNLFVFEHEILGSRLYVLGGAGASGEGLLIYELSSGTDHCSMDPMQSKVLFTDTYFHDFVSVDYQGSDMDYKGKEIGFGSANGDGGSYVTHH